MHQFNPTFLIVSPLNPPSPSYLMLACVVGFYSLPGFRRLKPRLHDTSMTATIGNCVVLLILSSALPVLSRILGTSHGWSPKEVAIYPAIIVFQHFPIFGQS